MTPVAFPAPGTTYGPDAASLDALREVLRAHERRGVWRVTDAGGRTVHEWCCDFTDIDPGDTWTLVRDTAEPEPKPARTVTATMWAFAWSHDGGETWETWADNDREKMRRLHANRSAGPMLCTALHKVRAALPLPVEPAVVVGEVSDAG